MLQALEIDIAALETCLVCIDDITKLVIKGLSSLLFYLFLFLCSLCQLLFNQERICWFQIKTGGI